jgi:photosystem II stability/assembly factor-like uncharacterized protein
MRFSTKLLSILVCLFLPLSTLSQISTQGLENALKWRNVGPFRGGRTRAVAGVPSEPNVFYAAQVNGGVWKTIDYGHTWTPIFDEQPTGSIGALAVAESNPNVVYAGSGEGLHRPDLSVGDGLYKSSDAGKTWKNMGLRDGQQITQIAVDSKNENRIFVAVGGHPYGPNDERGIFRSLDGGRTFERVLHIDENVGGSDVLIDPSNPMTVYAGLWESRQGPWENAAWNGRNGGIFKSTDGGTTWKKLSGGLPEGVIQVNLSISRSNSKRLFASVATEGTVGLYRTDDAGENWRIVTDDPRPAGRIGGGDLPVPRIDPKDENLIYMASTVSWKSFDGGVTWTALRGAPGGDDYQNVWINPNNTDIILLGSDQGAVVSVNRGKTWSDWYNQPTAQLYHVMADNDFPYRICSGQQESGSVCIRSRGDYGQVTMREWTPVGAEEYGYVTPDPLDPNIVYGGKLTRFDRRTGQAQGILPKAFRSADFRLVRTMPVIFNPIDKKTLYFSANTLWKTLDGGQSWTQISPDLTRKSYELPKNIGKYAEAAKPQAVQRGVIYTVAPSPKDIGLIWVGTDDGMIHVTRDGGANWQDVTPPTLAAWQKVSLIDAGQHDVNTAFAAVNTLRLDDLRPHIFRTRDGGKTWTEIVKGIPAGQTVNVVREDPVRPGLLYAGTERSVYVSFDSGDNWQPLRFNLPATSVRDLIVKDDDIVVATHGRGFWILDNVTPLRQIAEKQQTILFKPQTAVRVRWNLNTDTPLPPDIPAGQNPPDGASIDFYLGEQVSGEVVLEIKNAEGRTVRTFSSSDKEREEDARLRIPTYWPRPDKVLPKTKGFHRFQWDLHLQPIPYELVDPEYPIAAVPGATAPVATSPWVMPGDYTVTLSVNGRKFTETLTVKMDPRVAISPAALNRQYQLSYSLWASRLALLNEQDALATLSAELEVFKKKAGERPVAAEIAELQKRLGALAGSGPRRPDAPLSFAVIGKLTTLFDALQSVDAPPTPIVESAVAPVIKEAKDALIVWSEIQKSLPTLRKAIAASGLGELKLTARRIRPGVIDEDEAKETYTIP